MAEFVSPLSTVRSAGERAFDVDNIFQTLLLHDTLLEVEDGDSSAGSGSPLESARSTLRDLRLSGPLSEMSGEAFTRLLAGTLYEYDTSAPPTPMALPGPASPARSRERDMDETLGFLEAAVDIDGEVQSPGSRSVSGRSSATELPPMVSFNLGSEGSPSPSSTIGSATIGSATARSDMPLPSPWSTARSDAAQSDSFWRTARTVLGDTSASQLGNIVHHEGQVDGGVTAQVRGLLRQLAADGDLDESLVQSARRILQLGAVASGQRLSEEEIQALPKVRFEQAEQQTCPICLEIYQQGEILTALRCSHFFHTNCVTNWFQRSTQCPLCRAVQGVD